LGNDPAMLKRKNIGDTLSKTIHAFRGVLPVIVGMVLLTGFRGVVSGF